MPLKWAISWVAAVVERIKNNGKSLRPEGRKKSCENATFWRRLDFKVSKTFHTCVSILFFLIIFWTNNKTKKKEKVKVIKRRYKGLRRLEGWSLERWSIVRKKKTKTWRKVQNTAVWAFLTLFINQLTKKKTTIESEEREEESNFRSFFTLEWLTTNCRKEKQGSVLSLIWI